MESILKDSIDKYLNETNLLNSSQHGFTNGRSCLTNLLCFFESVVRYVDKKEAVDVVYLDFQKAFDRVPHQRLLLKIESIGIKGKVLTWLSAWLSNRQQRVVLNGGMSDWVNVRSGVPQGSVLGPLLFVIFINDIDADIISKIFKFADDCKVLNKATSVVDTRAIQDDLKKLFEWSLDWQLLFNLDKCKVMHIGSSNSKVDYYLGDHKLSVVHEEKDLGIIVQDDLNATAMSLMLVSQTLG